MSLVISADSQRLSASGFSPALWSSTTDLTIVAKVKVTASFWANFFGITDAGNETFNSAVLRAATGTVYDHLVRLQGDGSGRLEAAGSVNANAWDTIGITVLGGVARIAYLNGVATQTINTAQNTFNSPLDGIWIGFFQPEGLGQSTGRFKIAHCAAWKTGLSAAQHAALHNGGTAGAGVNPTSITASDLVFYAPLTADATVTTPSGLSLVATGSPTYDSGDNPPVDAPGGDTTPPTLSSPTGTGGVGVCSGTVSTNDGNGTLYAVATASATQPSVAQIKAGQDHTGAAALRAVSQSVTATGTQTIASGAISGGAGTRYLHYLHTDAASNDSNRVTSASFEVTANATSLVVTVPDAAGQSGFSAAVLSTSAPTTGSTVIKTATSLTFNGSGQVTIDITGLGIAVGAYRWVTLTNSDGTTTQSPAPVAASGPVIAS
jgi:hypothetical protein